ncbi:MAG TPA: OmpH family outer membrane protein [Candidatus Kapabacteria bacterium]|nr:OmpH family outer membrane protein [Candidatus Kapabacteria bacterium]
MRKNLKFLAFAILFLAFNINILCQKVGFVSSETIRKNFAEAKAAEQRVQTIVDEWKRELTAMKKQIEDLEFEIKKNRLIWTDTERAGKEKELQELISKRENYAKEKFEPGGEYDLVVREVMKPIEQKIYAAIQDVAAAEKYDIIWDQSTQPLTYVNFKYDITVKVLRRLGVDVSQLEKELDQKIKNDPRNQEQEEKPTDRTRRRSRATQTTEPTKQQEETVSPEEKEKLQRELERK